MSKTQRHIRAMAAHKGNIAVSFNFQALKLLLPSKGIPFRGSVVPVLAAPEPAGVAEQPGCHVASGNQPRIILYYYFTLLLPRGKVRPQTSCVYTLPKSHPYAPNSSKTQIKRGHRIYTGPRQMEPLRERHTHNHFMQCQKVYLGIGLPEACPFRGVLCRLATAVAARAASLEAPLLRGHSINEQLHAHASISHTR